VGFRGSVRGVDVSLSHQDAEIYTIVWCIANCI